MEKGWRDAQAWEGAHGTDRATLAVPPTRLAAGPWWGGGCRGRGPSGLLCF